MMCSFFVHQTSLLLSLMQELPPTSGKIIISTDSVAYVPQRAWLFGGTLQENILFGRPFEEKRFWEVVRAAALETDLEAMPLKEQTMVGERGQKLSGGQAARVSLARALYADADLYLLDDIFSAVDGKVGQLIVEQCINGYLREKTVVLVTHQAHLLANGLSRSSVLILDGHGSQARLVTPTIDTKEREFLLDELIDGGESSFTEGIKNEEHAENHQQKMLFATSEEVTEKEDDDDESESNKSEDDDHDHHDDHHSTSTSGKSKRGPYLAYLRCGFHWFTFTLMMQSILLSQTLSQGSDFLLSMWTEAFEERNGVEVGKVSPTPNDNNLYAYIYAGLIVALFVSTLVRATSFFSFCMTASRKLYNDSFEHVLLSPITFFHHTPAGRILNRFSRDIGIIDDYIPMTAFELQIVSVLLN